MGISKSFALERKKNGIHPPSIKALHASQSLLTNTVSVYKMVLEF